jgi:iron(III) transport system substrate-binding protein
MKRALASGVAVAAVFALAACSSSKNNSASSTTSAPATTTAGSSASGSSGAQPGSTSPSAQASGSATVYGALTAANGKALADAFHANHPNETVDIVTGGTGALVTRIETEVKAGGVRADALLLADPTVMPQLAKDGVIGDYEPAAASKLPADMVGTGWFGPFNFYNVIVYKTGTTPVPKDWADLTNPAYKGKIEMGDPSYSGTTLAMAAETPKLAGDDFFTKLKANDVKIVQSTNTVGNDVASGARPIGITLDSVYRPLASKGSAVQIVWPTSGAIPVPAPAALVKGHDSAVAKDFLDWLLTDDGQGELAKLGYTPALGSSGALPAGTKVVSVPFSDLVSQRDSILSAFTKVFG